MKVARKISRLNGYLTKHDATVRRLGFGKKYAAVIMRRFMAGRQRTYGTAPVAYDRIHQAQR